MKKLALSSALLFCFGFFLSGLCATAIEPHHPNENATQIIQNYSHPTPENIRSLFELGELSEAANDQSSAILFYVHLVKISDGQTDSTVLATRAESFKRLGVIYFIKSEYQKSLEYFLSSLKIKEATGDSIGVAGNLNNIGTVYFGWKDFDQAREYFSRGLELHQRVGEEPDRHVFYNNLGGILVKQGDYHGGMELFKKADSILTRYDQPGFDPKINIGYSYFKLGQYQNALNQYYSALRMADSLDRPDLKASTLYYLAEAYQEMKNASKAVEYLNEVIDLAKQYNLNDELKNSYRMLSDIYRASADYESALDYYQKYVEVKDEIFTEEKFTRIQELMILYETGKKEQEIQHLSAQKLFQHEKLTIQKKWLTVLATALAMIIVLLGLTIYMMRRKKLAYDELFRKNLEIAKKDKEKDLTELSENGDEISEKTLQQETMVNTEDESFVKKPMGTTINPQSREGLKKAILKIKMKPTLLFNHEFSLEKMATLVGSNRQYVSQIINEDFNQSFSDFVNESRIKEARKILSDTRYENYTIEAIGKMVGFKSKSAFNQAFKKFTGITPSFYQQSFRKSTQKIHL
jgi:tetratricopeptide (TPR) repeat protein